MFKQKNFIRKSIKAIAEVSGETTSWFALYEPKMPEKLIKNNKTKEKK